MGEDVARRVSRRLRLWVIGLAVGVLTVVGAAVLAWLVFFRDTTTPLTRDDVVGAVTTTVADGLSTLGVPGVYVYETTGFEEIDALTGARHDYPPETFITIAPAGCGTTVRWDALEERWTEWDLCRSDEGFSVSAVDSFHKWFGVSDLQQYTCADPGPIQPLDTSSAAVSFECTTGEKHQTYSVEVVGIETVVVGGAEVEAIHVRTVTSQVGTTVGQGNVDRWWLPGTALILREVSSGESTSESPIGDVRYVEQYEIRLKSLDPLS